ncbi:UDP-N-acetylmuramate--alanine ligase [Methanobrevibacter sp. YE315]|uniref:Mur ligase family protein n=1 Tax=Methanobrevibacter sp. YE315 TaxID=1609968 RepID=UPI000764E232|nr:Mur ligase family protein [Methanobrevibacter sp. YE315]AMD18349.1 UDP-N-acetylmuramate--alanine ligase [Methanobrevibacter sp. YE315]
MNKNKTFGVIGVCGPNGNLIARILKQRGYDVIGNDLLFKKDCKFAKTLEGYDIEVFYGNPPETFFKKADYIVPPASLSKDSDLFKQIDNPIFELCDVIELIQPEKPVFGVTGTNGKTTTTTLLKHIAYDNGIKPCEHDLEGMQGNAEFIPILQSRLDGDVGILEVGTFGVSGTIGRIVKNTSMSSGIITNITPDHLNDLGSFMDYAHVKGEFISELGLGQLIVNGQDPTIMGLLRELDFKGEVITFGVDELPDSVGMKECVCGNEIAVKEIISGCGYYFCKCGLTTPQVDYIATNVDLKNRTFDLHTPTEKLTVKMGVDGLHNVYNLTGVIIAAHKFLDLPYDKILPTIANFTGVSGRMEEVANIKGKDIFVDYAHNPGGVETVLKEFNKLYGDFTTVITVSSESGYVGDLDIFNSVLKFSKFIVPASVASQKIAVEKLRETPELNDRIFLNHIDDFEKTGTLGASKEEVIDGLKKALNLDCEMVIAIGEAAIKFKSVIFDL